MKPVTVHPLGSSMWSPGAVKRGVRALLPAGGLVMDHWVLLSTLPRARTFVAAGEKDRHEWNVPLVCFD